MIREGRSELQEALQIGSKRFMFADEGLKGKSHGWRRLGEREVEEGQGSLQSRGFGTLASGRLAIVFELLEGSGKCL